MVPAEAALSFLKDTKGAVTWSVRDLASTLKINFREAEQVVTLLAAQGYVLAEGNDWMTTSAGESVSNAKPPRFARESVEQAVESLKERMRQVNKDSKGRVQDHGRRRLWRLPFGGPRKSAGGGCGPWLGPTG